LKEDDMQGKRTRAIDSRGRPVPGLYVRDGRYIAGYKIDGRWTMRTLDADTLTEARRERESLLAGLREGRIAAPAAATFADVFAEFQAARSLSERTRKHERHLLDRHLSDLKRRRVQDVTATEAARLLRGMRDPYSPWTCVAVYRILAGTFALALRRGIVTRSPIDGLAPTERPKQRNAKRIAVLDAETIARLVSAGSTKRWRAALGLAGYAGLRLGEIRALTWGDVDRKAGTITVRRSMLPDGTSKAPKTAAGVRTSRCCRRCAGYCSTGKSARRTGSRTSSSSAPLTTSPSRSGTSAAHSTTRKRRPASTAPKIGCPGTRSVTRSRPCSRPTSSCRRRRLRG
jgi:integrase